MLQEFVDAGVPVNDPQTYYVNQFGDGQSENIETKESDYEYPLQEARCPDCDKLLAKKLMGTVSLYCSRCKKEIKFNDKSLTTTK
jgi:phage FluMu protein Com